MTQRLLLWLSAMLLALASLPGWADEAEELRWYQVELIAFSNNRGEVIAEELWPEPERPVRFSPATVVPALPGQDGDTGIVPVPEEETATDPYPAPFTQLRHGELELLPQAHRLARSRHHNLLLHIGWRQPLAQNRKPVAVFIHDRMETPQPPAAKPETHATAVISDPGLAPEALLQQALREEEQTLEDNPAGLPAPLDTEVLASIPTVEEGPPQSILFGTVSLRWSRFLHLKLNLVYRSLRQPRLAKIDIGELFPLAEEEQQSPADEADARQDEPETTPSGEFRLLESRRVKSNNLYYFDHPLFGVVVKIRPYQPEGEATE